MPQAVSTTVTEILVVPWLVERQMIHGIYGEQSLGELDVLGRIFMEFMQTTKA